MKKLNNRNWFFTIFAAIIAISVGACSIFFLVTARGDWYAVIAGIALGIFAITSLIAAIRDEPAILMLGLFDQW